MKRRHILHFMTVFGLGALMVFGTTGCCMIPHLYSYISDRHSGKEYHAAGTNDNSHVQHVHEPAEGGEG